MTDKSKRWKKWSGLPEINYEILPEHMRHGMKLWIEQGIYPGGFLTAVLENNLVGAFARADATNRNRMRDFAAFLYNEAPSGCWGSAEVMEKWAKERRERVSEQ